MKKTFYILMLVVSISLLAGCQNNNNSPPSTTKKNKEEEKTIDYKIDKIILSKGYQSVEPNVEIVKQNHNSKILATVGLIECSKITIDRITKIGDQINIYINKIVEKDETQLAIPQILLELNDPNIDKLENYNFNIINQNYKPINLKFGKNDILNKLYCHFKIAPNTTPEVELVKLEEKIIWSIKLNNIYDKEDSNNPLINLDVKIDAITGEILTSNKEIISKYIDEGIILDYAPNKYLLYKRKHKDNDQEHDTLWIYNLETKEKEKLYSSRDSIYSAQFNPQHTNIALIEHDDDKTDIFLISTEDNDVKNITQMGQHSSWFIKWQNNNDLYFVNNDTKSKSTIYKYELNNSETKTIFEIDKNVLSFDIMNNIVVFTEFDEENINKKIFITTDGSKLKEIDTGFKANFLSNGNLIYLKNKENEDRNIFYIYDIEKDIKNVETKYNIVNYFSLNDTILTIVVKNNCNNDYTLMKYNIEDQSSEAIAKVTDENMFYNEDKNIGYITLSPTIENSDINKDKNIIYSVNLDNLKTDD